ncbi:MAG: murein biosynthesis integral membrane protein MurJ, partial [Candidatus Magasanikbacteria bacterium]|nr:murein biosynthesis integral membrane protein MurJ [Candidatus Magasanikbacteria bacterium]
ELTRIMMLSPMLMGASALVGGALQSLKKFFIFALAPIMYNVGIILGVLLLVPIFGTRGLAMGVVLGAALHLGVQFPALHASGYNFKFIWSWGHKDISSLLKLMGPRVLALAATQINLVFITMFASTLGDGAVSVFNLANNIQYVPIGMIAVSFAVAAFPVMTQFAAEENPDGFSRTIGSTMRMIFVTIIPMSILIIILRAQFVRIILGSGAFNWDATRATADALGFFALGLLGQSLVHVLARGFYALKNSRTPAICGIISVVIGVTLGYFLKNKIGVSGLAFTVAIQETLNATLLWILLRHSIGDSEHAHILKTIYKLAIASLVMIVVTQGTKLPIAWFVNTQTFIGIFLQAAGASIAGIIAFISVGLLLKIEEVYTIFNSAQMKIKNVIRKLPNDLTDTSALQ